MGSRRSVRKFLDKDVEEEKLQKILECCNKAPSAGNLQAYKIFLVRDKEKKQAFANTTRGQDFIDQASVVLVFCALPKESGAKYGERGEALYSVQDATIAATHSQLAATALGLGTVWVGAFDEGEVLKILGEQGVRPVAIIPIGYPDEEPETRGRKPLDEVVKEF